SLDLIYLTKTKRRNFSKNEIANEDQVIPGDYFIVKYSDVKNLNITYHFRMSEKPSGKQRIKNVFLLLLGVCIVFGLPTLVIFLYIRGNWIMASAILSFFIWVMASSKHK